MPKSRNRSRDAKKRAKKKRLAKEKLLKVSSGVDWSKVPEVIHPDELKLFRQKVFEDD